jgi:hypothetical protein
MTVLLFALRLEWYLIFVTNKQYARIEMNTVQLWYFTIHKLCTVFMQVIKMRQHHKMESVDIESTCKANDITVLY